MYTGTFSTVCFTISIERRLIFILTIVLYHNCLFHKLLMFLSIFNLMLAFNVEKASKYFTSIELYFQI